MSPGLPMAPNLVVPEPGVRVTSWVLVKVPLPSALVSRTPVKLKPVVLGWGGFRLSLPRTKKPVRPLVLPKVLVGVAGRGLGAGEAAPSATAAPKSLCTELLALKVKPARSPAGPLKKPSTDAGLHCMSPLTQPAVVLASVPPKPVPLPCTLPSIW